MTLPSCPKCGLDTIRPASSLGYGRRDTRWQSWMFNQIPIALGLSAAGIAGWCLIVFAAMMLGLTHPWWITVFFFAGVAASLLQGIRLSIGRKKPYSASESGPKTPDQICLNCRGFLFPDTDAEPLPFQKLAVRGEVQDKEHLRSLVTREAWLTAKGLTVPLFCLLMGIALFYLASWITWRHYTGKTLWGMGGGFALFFELLFLYSGAAMAGLLGLLFLKLWKAPPLVHHVFDPKKFSFASAEIFRKHISGPLLEVVFTDGTGRKIHLLQSWSDVDRYFVSPGEEEELKPQDDGYALKEKQLQLPVPAWVLYEKQDPWNASLVGLPQTQIEKWKELQTPVFE